MSKLSIGQGLEDVKQKVAAFKSFMVLRRKEMFSRLHTYYRMWLNRKEHSLTIFIFQGPSNLTKKMIGLFMTRETKIKMRFLYCILYIFLLFK